MRSDRSFLFQLRISFILRKQYRNRYIPPSTLTPSKFYKLAVANQPKGPAVCKVVVTGLTSRTSRMFFLKGFEKEPARFEGQ